MKKTVIFCDICKKDISHEDKRYRFKKYDITYINYDDFEWNKWTKLDMCHDCYCGFLAYLISTKRSDNNAR